MIPKKCKPLGEGDFSIAEVKAHHKDTKGAKMGLNKGKVHHRETEDTELELNNITEDVIGAAIEVDKALQPGLVESAYVECLCRGLALRGIPFEPCELSALPVILW